MRDRYQLPPGNRHRFAVWLDGERKRSRTGATAYAVRERLAVKYGVSTTRVRVEILED